MKSLSERKTLYILAGALAGTGCIIMAIFPSIALESAQNGVLLWASSVLPALLPFFICSNFMIALGVPELVGRLFEEPFRRIFGAPGASAFVFTISVFSGYPTGPKLIGDMGRRGEITPKEAKRMLTFCSTSGPLFMLGAVGVGILYSSGAGVVIALSHYLGSIFNGILFRIFTGHSRREEFQGIKHTKRKTNNQARPGNIPQKNLLDIFTDSIVSSLKAMGIICGYIVLFTLITDFIQFSGILNLFQSGYTKGFIKGLFEMTVGCNSIGRVNDHQILLKSILCSFLISFGGISVMAQSMSMLSNLRIVYGTIS
jgi:sporulation integral membrane protein YlbJ